LYYKLYYFQTYFIANSNLMKIYFNDCIQVSEESANLTVVENEMIGNL